MKSNKPLLSVAMIVKDEEEEIGECIDNVKLFADEICIVDTGSVDNTGRIAREKGARIVEVEWRDDFSYARNKSLELCEGKWIFVIDADERVSKEDGEKLRQLAERGEKKAYRIWTRNYVLNTNRSDFEWKREEDEWNAGYSGWYTSAKVRLFPNDERIRFEGYVHETVVESVIRLGMPIENYFDVVVHHYPERKSKERLKAKKEKYLLLGLKKVNEHPDNPQFLAELAVQYVELERLVEGVEYYRRALMLNPQCGEWWAELGAILLMLKAYNEAEECLKLAVNFNKSLVHAWRHLAIVYMIKQEWGKVFEPLERVLELQPENPEALEILGFLFLNIGENEKAKDYLLRSLKSNPSNNRVIEAIKKYFS